MPKNKSKLVFITIAVFILLYSQAQGNEEPAGFLRLYVASDVHVGYSDKGQNMLAFAEMCNINNPDIVLDLGDTIQGRTTRFYDYHADKEAALKQMQDWLKAWNHISIYNKEVALGNRDVAKDYPLGDKEWIQALGYESRPERGGTMLQGAFTVQKEHLRVLVMVFCTYSENFDKDKTIKWAKDEVLNFKGDFIIFCNHHADIYPDLQSTLKESHVKLPAIFLHGHAHGPDTLVRDAWGLEQESFDFPSYLVTPLMGSGIAVKFKLYPDGAYEIFRLNVISREISEPIMHYQTLLSEES